MSVLRVSRNSLLSAAALWALPLGIGGAERALAQTAVPLQADRLPEITVSSHQVPLERDRSGTSVTVITGTELREKNLQTVADALRGVPGVEVDASGGRGSLTAVRIRGGESRHVMVVIDGVEVNQLGFPGFDFADLLTDDIERLEVLRGPQSGIYGASAQSGVISIVTRSGKGLAKPSANLRVETGSRNTNTVAGGARGSAGPAYGAISFAHYNTHGYNVSRTGDERDGSRATSLNANGGIQLTPDLNIDGVFRYVDRGTDLDATDFTTGFLVDRGNTGSYKSTNGRVGATFSTLGGAWVHNANVKIFQEHSRAFNTANVPTSGADGTRVDFDYKSTFTNHTNLIGGEKHTAVVFVAHRDESYQQIAGARGLYEKRRESIAGEYILDLPTNTTLTGALRQDWNSAFDDALTWRATLSQRFPTWGSRLHASAGSGVTDPDVFALFGSAFNLANPDLTPEKSVGWDIGWEQRFWNDRALVDVTYFSTNFDNKIEFLGNRYVNGIGEATRRGVEVAQTTQWVDWLSTTLTYTYTNANSSTGQQEIRRPPHSASFEVIATLFDRRTRLNARVSYNGVREDSFFGPAGAVRVDLPAYYLARATLSHDVTPWMTAYVRAENVFNARYEEVYTYRAPGFAVFAGLKLRDIEAR